MTTVKSDKSKPKASCLKVRADQSVKDLIKPVGFTESDDSVRVLVISYHGVEEISFVPHYGNDHDGGRGNMIVEQTDKLHYLERRKDDPSLPKVLAERNEALEKFVENAEAFSRNEEGRLLYKGTDFRSDLRTAKKASKVAFRMDNPLDVYSDKDLAKPKGQRRKLKKAKAMTDSYFDSYLEEKYPRVKEALDAYNSIVGSKEAIAAADEAAPIKPYHALGGPRADEAQRVSALRTEAEADIWPMHDKIVRALYASRDWTAPQE